MESKYLKQFAKLEQGQLPLRGNRLLVEVLPKEEIKKGSIIIASQSDTRTSTEQNRAELAVVLAVGPGYFDEKTDADVPMDIKPGNVILISRLGMKLYSQFPGLVDYTSETIALTRDSEVHANWPSIDAYLTYRERLNA